MTTRTNKQAIYAKKQETAGTAETFTDKANLIPISTDISKTFLEDNSVERPELRGTFGAPDSVIISQTQSVSIPSFIQGGGVKKGADTVVDPPVRPLLEACFHKVDLLKKDGSTTEETTGSEIIQKYSPSDDDIVGATILYQIDGIQQIMEEAKGTMSLNMAVGEFASMTFEMQSPYVDPTVTSAPTGNPPTFKSTLAVSGQNTLSVPGLFNETGNKLFDKVCVRSFSLTQGVTISAIDCATREGGNAIKYVQTARAATGEIVVDVEAESDELAKLVATWGGQKPYKAPFTVASGDIDSALVVLTETWDKTAKKPDYTTGNTFAVAASNFKIGAPTLGDSDGIATWTFPLTFIPSDGKPDYELYYIGSLKA